MKKKWQQRWAAVVIALGFTDKAKAGKLTKEEQMQIFSQYEADYKISFEADKKADEDVETPPPADILSADEQTEIANLLGITENAPPPATQKEAVNALGTKVVEQKKQIETLELKPENSDPAASVKVTDRQVLAIGLGHSAHSASHLFGIEHTAYARGNWWNDLVVTAKVGDSDPTIDEITAFKAAFNSYATGIKNRVNELHANHQLSSLNFPKMIAGEQPIDYSGLTTDLLGSQYMVRRQDLIIAYFRTLESVAGIFPVRSGVQDKQVAINSFFGEFSQAYTKGRVFKGSVKFTPEFYRVTNVMFKHMFDNLKDLENQYIGYLNKEGSNPMKWSFIEWMLVNIFAILFNEQQRRRVIGVTVPVQTGVDNPAMFGADGALRAIERVEEELKVLPFTDLTVYSDTTILDYFEEMWGKVDDILPNVSGYRLHANKKHRKWYLKAYRDKYGKDIDFQGVQEKIIDLSPENIIWVPNMDKTDFKVWITIPGNIENYELTPGEMLNVYFQQDLEALMSASWWKEGAGLIMAGMQCASVAELEETGRKFQYIFTNYPVTALADGATTIDGGLNTVFKTVNNTADTALVDIANASQERVYKIICGGTTHATAIAKAGKFAKIASPWNPTAVGDYIKVYAELELKNVTINGETQQVTQPTGNWLELERKVTA